MQGYKRTGTQTTQGYKRYSGTSDTESAGEGACYGSDRRRLVWEVPLAGKGVTMGIILVLLLLALIFAGVGFAVHVLWIVAIVLFAAWLVSLALGSGRRSSTPR